MKKELDLKLLPKDAQDEALIRTKAAEKLNTPVEDIQHIQQLRRSIDARAKQPYVRLRVAVYRNEEPEPEPQILQKLSSVGTAPKVLIVGAGPAGYFAALELIELGYRPIIFDRGKDVRQRRRDLRAIQQFGEVNPHSNYCFGEGGAGTYSDGKLYTRSKKRGKIIKVLRLLVEHGAKSDILVDAYPHIGSNKLPKIVTRIRETIESQGGEVHFNSHVVDFIVEKGKAKGLRLANGDEHFGEALLLATGHSARDIFELLHRKNIHIEAKPFALGVRIEHPQRLIDRIQYNQEPREEALPASSYRLACQVDGRGVFSFCMCPGGLIVPAATAPGELVVNGMSMSRRDSAYANSGLVVAVELEDLAPYKHHGVFTALEFQKATERKLFEAGDGGQSAPAQRIHDFVENRMSKSLSGSSYIPGLYSAPMHELLPEGITKRLQEGLQIFGQKMKGYFSSEAQIVGVESRTSSPVRIPRDRKTLMHQDVQGLFPCGEGAGYAGGIVSAAMDGQNVAKAIKRFLEH